MLIPVWGAGDLILLDLQTPPYVANQQQKFISHRSRGCKFKIMVPVWSGSSESPPLGCRQLTSRRILTRQKRSEPALQSLLILWMHSSYS